MCARSSRNSPLSEGTDGGSIQLPGAAGPHLAMYYRGLVLRNAVYLPYAPGGRSLSGSSATSRAGVHEIRSTYMSDLPTMARRVSASLPGRRLVAGQFGRGLALLLVLVALLGAWWRTIRQPEIHYLRSEGAAEWVIYPTPPSTTVHRVADLATVFRRHFGIASVPASVGLKVRAFRRSTVRLNGREVPMREPPTWKEAAEGDVGGVLRVGDNLLEIEVHASDGPASVAGAEWRPAWPARNPVPGRRHDPLHRVPSAWGGLAERLIPIALAAMVIASILLAVAHFLPRDSSGAWASGFHGWPWVLTGGIAVSWVCLFVNNVPWLPLRTGYDAGGHLEYIDYILANHTLPLADQGWQMFQPPLYYMVSALALGAGSLTTSDPGAVWVLRCLGLAFGLLNVLLVGASLRLLYPGNSTRQGTGIVLAGFLPCMLCLHQFPTNEILVACLGSATFLVTLCILRGRLPQMRGHALAGALLGCALLAKFSALLLVPVVIGALFAHALAGSGETLGRRLAPVGLAVLTALVVCAWHFMRVWSHFGDPFVGGWVLGRGHDWWQDPGFRTVRHFTRAGSVLDSPLFAGFQGFWDGLYSTLWGDGLLSGRGGARDVPPWWSPSWMSAGIALALVPSAAAIAGAVAETVAWIKSPTAERHATWLWAADDGSPGLDVPARPFDLGGQGLLRSHGPSPAGGRRRARTGPPSVAPLLGRAGSRRVRRVGNRELRLFLDRRILGSGEVDPGHIPPREWRRRPSGAAALASHRSEPLLSLEGRAEYATRHHLLGRLAQRDGDVDGALREATKATELEPDLPEGHALRALMLEVTGEQVAAVDAWRQVLRIDPQNIQAHVALARLYSSQGRADAAGSHAEYAAGLAGRR